MSEPDAAAREEAALVRRCAQGDEAAWARFVDLEAPRVAGFARRMLLRRTGQAPEADVEEVVAEVLLSLLRQDRRLLRVYDPRWRLSTWLAVLTRTALGRLLRRRGRGPLPAIDRQAPAADPAAAAEGREAARRLSAALAALPPRDALLLRLRFAEGLDYAAIGRALGVEASSVGPLLTRAKGRLRDRLEAPPGGEPERPGADG